MIVSKLVSYSFFDSRMEFQPGNVFAYGIIGIANDRIPIVYMQPISVNPQDDLIQHGDLMAKYVFVIVKGPGMGKLLHDNGTGINFFHDEMGAVSEQESAIEQCCVNGVQPFECGQHRRVKID